MNFLIHNSSYVIFNLQFDKRDTKQLLQLLHSTGLSQRVCQLTHRQGHVLDWGITRESPVNLVCSTDIKHLQLLHSTGLSQRVCQLTHRQGHVLDWGITRESPVHLICSTDVEDLHLFGHFPRDSYYKHVKTKKAEKGDEVQKCKL